MWCSFSGRRRAASTLLLLSFQSSICLGFIVLILGFACGRRGVHEEPGTILRILIPSLAPPQLQLLELQPDLVDIRLLLKLVKKLFRKHFLQAGTAVIQAIITAHPLLFCGSRVQG